MDLFEVFKGDRGNLISVRGQKMTVPNRGDWASRKEAVGHWVEVVSVVRDTKPDSRRYGVRFVTTRHTPTSCPTCQEEVKKKAWIAEGLEIAKGLAELEAEYARVSALYEKTKARYDEAAKYECQLRLDRLGEYAESYPTHLPEISPKQGTLPRETTEIGSEGYRIYWDRERGTAFARLVRTVGTEWVLGMEYESNDTRGTRRDFYLVPVTEELDPPDPLPPGVAEQFARTIEIARQAFVRDAERAKWFAERARREQMAESEEANTWSLHEDSMPYYHEMVRLGNLIAHAKNAQRGLYYP